jgi:hypothetical protein
MRAAGQADIDRARAMLVERGGLAGRGLEEGVDLSVLQRRAGGERDAFFEQRAIAGNVEIVRGDLSKPDPVVGHPRAQALTRRRQPPVLNVAFAELPRGGAQQMLARDVGPRDA